MMETREEKVRRFNSRYRAGRTRDSSKGGTGVVWSKRKLYWLRGFFDEEEAGKPGPVREIERPDVLARGKVIERREGNGDSLV